MKKFSICASRWLVAMSLGVCVAQAMAQDTLRPEVAKALKVAQDALAAKQSSEALDQSRKALALPQLTPYERLSVLRTLAVAAIGAQSWDTATNALEELVQSGAVPASDKLPMYESLVRLAQQQKDYARLVRHAQAYRQAGGNHPVIRTVMVQSLSLLGQHSQVVTAMQDFLALDDAQGRKTPEEELRALAVGQRQLKNDEGYREALWRLLSAHDKPEYWAQYITHLLNTPGFNSRLELDLYRLFEDKGLLEEADEYVEMAQLALKAGLPAEAVRVMAKGFDKGVLGKGSSAAQHARLRDEAQKKMREDDAQFAQMEKSAKDGPALAILGDVHFSRQNWSAAHEVYARALQAGGLRRESEVRLHHAISLLRAGQKQAARDMLRTVQGDATSLELARLWTLMAR